MNDIEEYWNKIIESWLKDGVIPESESFWFEEQKHLKLHKTLMPEPYWGDIDHNSVVFVNLNPACAEIVTEDDTSHIAQKDNKQSVCGYFGENYSERAKSFPLLGQMQFEYDGAEWWKKRVKWLNHFGLESDRQPFAIELCGWHSKGWSRAKYSNKKRFPQLESYIKEKFGPWLERALRGSQYHLALCIGKEFVEKVIPIIWPNYENIPVFKSYCPIEGNTREFRIVRIPGVGHIICTSVRGSNGLPSMAVFGQKEADIIKKLNIYVDSKSKCKI